MQKEFNQKEYIKNYKKKNYKQFKVDLIIKDKEDLDMLLQKNNLTKKDFVLKAKKILEKNENFFKNY